jgi:hypothetical protein
MKRPNIKRIQKVLEKYEYTFDPGIQELRPVIKSLIDYILYLENKINDIVKRRTSC